MASPAHRALSVATVGVRFERWLELRASVLAGASGSGIDLIEKRRQPRREDVVVVPGDHMARGLDINALGVGNQRQHVREPSLADDV